MVASISWGYDADAITLWRPMNIAPIFLGNILLCAVLSDKRAALLPLLTRFLPWTCLLAATITLVNLYGDSIIYKTLHGSDILPNVSGTAHLNRGIVSLTFMILFTLVMLYRVYIRPAITTPQWVIGMIIALISCLIAMAVGTESQTMQISIVLVLLGAAIPCVSNRKTWMLLSIGLSLAILSAPFVAQYLFKHVAPLAAPQYIGQTIDPETGEMVDDFEKIPLIADSFVANRMEIWDFVSRRALQHPLLGHGVEATRSIDNWDFAHLYHKEDMVLHPHNFVIQIWIEFGLLGAVLACIAFAWVLRSIWRVDDIFMRRFILGIFISALGVCASSYGIWQSWWIGFWGFVIAMVPLILTKKTDKTS